jgi:dienelactone hydrolase
MRRVSWLLLLALTLRAESPEERTRQVLDLVLQGKYESFYALFSPEMKKAISLEQYSGQAKQLFDQLGKPAGIGEPKSRAINGATTVTIPVRWPAATLNFIVSWNAAGQVQGTWFQAAQPAPRAQYETAPYSNPAAFTARDVTIGADPWKLPGTLLVPKGSGPFPGLVLVHGSGPNDRDETIGGAKVFRDLAEGLASRGIAVLRYDKRTFAHRKESAQDRNLTMTRETVDDAVLAAALLRTQAEIDPRRVYVLGHSQGGYMLPRIMHADPKLAGVIVMAGNVRPIEELIVDQTEYLFAANGGATPEQQKQIETMRNDPWKALPGIPDSYRADLRGYDPVKFARESRVPMLILQGERDYQVTMKDFELWKKGLGGRPNVTFHSFPKLNHLFIAGEGKSLPQEYERAAHVDAEVIDAIAHWILPDRHVQ